MSSDLYESLISKLTKLKALADRGMPNEKETAFRKFKELLTKYGIDELELVNPDIVERKIKYGKDKDACRIMCQVIWSICSNVEILFISKERCIYTKISYLQYIECQNKFKYYWKLYKKQRETFYLAFIQKNKLYPEESTDAIKLDDVMSPDEMKNMLWMMTTLEEGNYVPVNKMLEI